MRDLDAIELTESITGEAILPRDVDDADHQPGEVARVESIADHVWMDAPDAADYSASNPGTPLHTFTDEQLRQHDAEVAAKALDAIADHEYVSGWGDGVDECAFGGVLTRCRATRARHIQPEPEECETCHGSGRVDRGIGRGHYTDSCDDCDGQGVREVER
jgi:hypothetical protein